MSSLSVSDEAWRGATVSLHILAISTTTFRLVHRCRKNQYCWDDLWAAFALILDLGFFSAVWIRSSNGVPAIFASPKVRIARYWISALFLPCVVWTSRISIGLSVLRIVQISKARKRILTIAIFSFSLMWLAIVLHKIVVCATDSSWHMNKSVQCHTGEVMGIFTLCANLCADACLVIVPLQMFTVTRPTTQLSDRRMVQTVFSLSAVSSAVSIIYALFSFMTKSSDQLKDLTYHIKGTITLMVCNMIVILPCLYRLFRKETGDPGSLSFTIDLSQVGTATSDQEVPISVSLTHVTISQVEQAVVRYSPAALERTFRPPFASLFASRANPGSPRSTQMSPVVERFSEDTDISGREPESTECSPSDEGSSVEKDMKSVFVEIKEISC
ncbi:hypothetical protein AX17_006831 [Amanita inopinata Kibby_2008]|nr:hypothetical protein AX17_006831 [Amanita inopinata Kibby_2008]